MSPTRPTTGHSPPPGCTLRPAARAAGLTLLATVALGAACGASGGDPSSAGPTSITTAEPGPGTTASVPQDGSLAEVIRPLPAAPASPTKDTALPAPATLDLRALDVAGAPVVPVGVEPDGDMEIPGVTEVGWYRHGPLPGDGGSAVRPPMSPTTASMGSSATSMTWSRATKWSSDSSTAPCGVSPWRRWPATPSRSCPTSCSPAAGHARLVLITCGGTFDTATGRYEDNVVAYARPT